MNNLKFILILFLIIFSMSTSLATECPVAHCWYQTAIYSNPTVTTTGCVVAANINYGGKNYTEFGTPGVSFSANGFGYYNFACDNGANQNFPTYAVTFVNGARSTTNSSQDTSINSGSSICVYNSSCPSKGPNLGFGNLNTISSNFSTVGDNNYKLGIATLPVAGTYGSSYDYKYNKSMYIGYPSLIVSGQGDFNTGYFEQFGSFSKTVIFTLINPSPLDAKLTNYEIRYSGRGVTGSVDKSYLGYIIPSNGKMIIRGTINIDKSNLPSDAVVSLDVNYESTVLNSAACGIYKTNSTSSKPTKYNFGLLDQQKFQIGMKASEDYKGCVGEDGLIGVSGSNYAPRINIGFGGTTDAIEKISIDECDLKQLDGTTDNTDWVYCNQKELLIELTQKVGKMWDIEMQKLDTTSTTTRNTLNTNKQKYASSYKTSIRTQEFSSATITNSINSLSTNFNEFTTTVLPNSAVYLNYGNNSNEKIDRLKKLFNKTSITVNGGTYTGTLDAGSYPVTISVETVEPITYRELFNPSTGELNPSAKISINFEKTSVSYPELKWFFYDYGYQDFNTDNLNIQSSADFSITNDLVRGTLLTTTQAENSINFNSDNKFYPTKVNTITVRLKSNNIGNTDTNFVVSGIPNYSNDLFSYWTGIGTDIDDGCTDIDDSPDSTLPYRTPDSNILSTTSNSAFVFKDYTSSKPNKTIYLQSVLFWPINAGSATITAPFGMIIDGTWYDGNRTTPAVRQINALNSAYAIDSIEELFEGIKQNKVCVNKTINPNRSISWNLFWNQDKIITDINSSTRAIISNNRDANICETRAVLGN